MLVNQTFFEAKSKFNEIQKLCLHKCMVVTSYKKRRVDFFHHVEKSCATMLKNSEDREIQTKTDFDKIKLQGQTFLDKICQNAYVSARQSKVIDYPFYYKKSKLLEWKSGQNPYIELQNIGKQGEQVVLDFQDVLDLFCDIIQILKEDDDLLETIFALKGLFLRYGVDIREEQ